MQKKKVGMDEGRKERKEDKEWKKGHELKEIVYDGDDDPITLPVIGILWYS